MAPKRRKKQSSLAAAEKQALQGKNESQDSQQILNTYMIEYGIGMTSSSPACDDRGQTSAPARSPGPQLEQQAPGNSRKVLQTLVGQRRGRSPGAEQTPVEDLGARTTGSQARRDAPNENRDLSGCSIPTTVDASLSELAVRRSDYALSGSSSKHCSRQEPLSSPLAFDDGGAVPTVGDTNPGPVVEGPNPFVRTDHLPTLRASGEASLSKMDSSQSPTQSNDGRSYERYFQRSSPSLANPILSTDPIHGVENLSQSTSHEQRTLDVDDTGIVSFALSNLPSHHTESSPVLERSGVVDFGALGRLRHGVTRDGYHHLAPPAPETPAAPRNPFGAEHRVSLMPDSQLFGQTQFSSAIRRVSPTSSRPSPNDFPQNSISPNPIISSPLKTRGLRSSPLLDSISSPQVLPDTSSRLQVDSTPYHSAATKEPSIPDSPRYDSPQRGRQPGLLAEYEPMRKSQERREDSELHSESSDGSEDDLGDEEVQRRRRIRSKKEAAVKQLTSINFPRPPSSEDVEVPSTNKKKSRLRSGSEEYLSRGPTDNADDDSQSTVADSQEQTVKHAGVELLDDDGATATDVDEPDTLEDLVVEVMPSTAPTFQALGKGDKLSRTMLSFDADNGEAIPETSPTEAHGRPLDDVPKSSSIDASRPTSLPPSNKGPVYGSSAQEMNIPVSSLPDLPKQPAQASEVTSYRHEILGSDNVDTAAGKAFEPGRAGPEEPASSARTKQAGVKIPSWAIPSSPPALSTRARTRRQDQATVNVTPTAPSSSAPHIPIPSTSTLSTLSRTPDLSHDTSPLTQGSTSSSKENPTARDPGHSSPAIDKVKRRDGVESLPKLKIGLKESLRASTRLTRKQYQQDSSSADELGRSPSATPTFEHSLRNARPGRLVSKGQSAPREQGSRVPRVFEGMAFAISFQSKKPGESSEQYDGRMEFAKAIERKIELGGGKVLSTGFDELFEVAPVKTAEMSSATSSPPDTEIKLALAARSTGFAALIADGHSRKVKYMQALALGLPCIAPKWITTCLDKQEIIDWSPYLLCAGVSAFLGDAIRSRNLLPYDAKSAKLCEVVQERPRLLEGSRILLVMKKSEENKKMAYIFLARVLGASLSRVYTPEEARAKLKASEDLGRPFDWVYVDEKLDKAELFLPGPSVAESKKRKRASSAAPTAPPSKRIRTLSDELVIQSLILGRLIEEDEQDE